MSRQQNDRSFLAQQLAELDGGTAGLDDLDHIARLDLVRGDVDTLAIDSEVIVGNQLAGVAAGLGKAQTVDDVVETALDEDQQVDTSLAGHAGGLLVVGMELVLQDTIDELDLLLLVQLGGVLALPLSHLAAGITIGGLLAITHNSRRNAESTAALSDRLGILSHISCSPFNQTRRRLGGRQPLWGMGVTSRIMVTSRPVACRARIALSRPEPGPLT